jgi:hypothetical protein
MHPTSHMAGPHAFWEYALVACAIVVLVWVLYKAFMYTIRPGEEAPDHIKRRILESNDAPPERKGR